MARSNIAHALETVDVLRERWLDRASDLFAKLGLWDAELDDWRDAVERIVTGFDPVTGLFEEFAGFHALELIDLREYASRDEPIDLIIGAERTKRTRVVRQADIVALITLLPDKFPEAIAEKNFRYYEPICAHGSSLSAGAHALVAARTGQADLALHYLRETASRDLDLDPNSAGGVRIADFDSLWGRWSSVLRASIWEAARLPSIRSFRRTGRTRRFAFAGKVDPLRYASPMEASRQPFSKALLWTYALLA